MEGKRFLHSIRLQNLLSYGSYGHEIELGQLNILIGPNGSGKSNLIAAIDLLRSAPDDLLATINQGGGVEEWLWKGESGAKGTYPTACIDATLDWPSTPLRYSLAFTRQGTHFIVVRESVEGPPPPNWPGGPYYVCETRDRDAIIRPALPQGVDGSSAPPEQRTSLMYGNKSVLNQIRGPGYPELTYLAKNFSSIGLFRMASFGPSEQIRQPQSTDRPDGFVEEDGRNLALVVHRLRDEANLGDFLTEKLKVLIEDLERISTPIRSGTIQIGLHLRGQRDPILAAHLSDGTLRYLSLLAILCDPNPPPLVCIEEPELGMHPDLIRTVGSLLLEASERTQLVVTTHADLLISALGDAPESVLICERGEDGTELHRLDPERMKEWLERYSLGDLWLKGAIGGTRW